MRLRFDRLPDRGGRTGLRGRKTMAPNIMPNRAELAMKPALPALTPMSFMIEGNAAPTTARS